VSRAPFIGRERHLAVLHEAFESSREGRLVTVWVHGRSGVGKTALVQRFLHKMRQRNEPLVLEGRCYEREAVPYNALDGVVDNLDRYVRSLPGARAQALMPDDLAALTRLFPVLQEWQTVGDTSPELANASDLQELRRRGFAAFRQLLDRVAMRQPLVLFIDDLQWGDEDSADLLSDLIKGSCAPLLLVACYRSEEADSSPLLRRLTPLRAAPGGPVFAVDLALEELAPAQAAELASALLEEAPSSPVAQAQIIGREAQGNPFFIGELVRYAQMRTELQANSEEFAAPGAGTQAGMAVPSMGEVIRARFSRLPAATRRLLEVVAVARQPVDLQIAKGAARISGGGHAEIHQLRAARLVRTRKTEGAEQVEAYHDRIREVTEASLGQELLKRHHYQLAIEWEASTRAGPRVLAIHFRGGGVPDKAFHYAVEAAQQAQAALALAGAIEFYRMALEALPGAMPESLERDSRELALRQSLWVMFFFTKGNAAPEVVDTSERIAALAEKTGNLAQLANSVFLRGTAAFGSGDLPAAGALADQALELALREGSPGSLASAYMLQIVTRHRRGDLAGAEQHFMAGLKFFDDPGVRRGPGAVAETVFFFASLNACALGRANIARKRIAQMMAGLNESNRYNVTCSACFAAGVRLHLREYDQAEASAARAVELAEKYQFAFTAASARCYLGSARAELGRPREGIALLRQGIAGLIDVGAPAPINTYTYLAAAQERDGAVGDALETVEQALRGNPHELSQRPESLRLRGELRVKQGQTELAEAGFREAIALARKIGAKAWELRATTSLGEMLARHGRRDEARSMLAEIYGWFTEGFDTADLKDAKALLDELSA
ncbi:MAG TPA: AAA family ATPase, partial [Candidatus Binataceae bacterium]|nr:AAA family ATPase [Candidatus Binataceae bacterium]